MADEPIRQTREVIQLPGVGGTMEFAWFGVGLPTEFRGTTSLFVKRWRIIPKYINARLAMSGGKGSLQYRRVAVGFDFIATVDLDLTVLAGSRDPGPGPHAQSFVDGRLEGHPNGDFQVSMRFLCGDPTFVSDPELQSIFRTSRTFPVGSSLLDGLYYSCKEVILDTVECDNSAEGDDVVGYVVRGHGSAPLKRNIGRVWAGAGAFGLTEALSERD
jgi:hypothetical protein